MVSDFQSYYGLDLRDLWRDEPTTLTPRYVLWLVEHLPQSSATLASMRGGSKYRPWTAEVNLLAAMVNLLAGANHQRAGKPMKRPLVSPPKPSATTKRQGRRIDISKMSGARRITK